MINKQPLCDETKKNLLSITILFFYNFFHNHGITLSPLFSPISFSHLISPPFFLFFLGENYRLRPPPRPTQKGRIKKRKKVSRFPWLYIHKDFRQTIFINHTKNGRGKKWGKIGGRGKKFPGGLLIALQTF